MRSRNILFIIGFSFLLFSCDAITQAYKETFGLQDDSKKNRKVTIGNTSSENGSDKQEDVISDHKVVNLLEDAEKLDQIQQQLQALFPEKSLMIFPPHIYVETNRIRLRLVDPDIPENIDWYYYRADTDAWQKEEPVKTSVHDRSKPILLDNIQFGTAHHVYRQLIQKTQGIEGAELPSTIYFSFHVPVWNWNARIRGSRADYNFKADKEGKEIEFSKQ